MSSGIRVFALACLAALAGLFVDVEASRAQPFSEVTVATLPGSPSPGDTVWVTDGTGPTAAPGSWDCETPGVPPVKLLCSWNGSAWVATQRKLGGSSGTQPPEIAVGADRVGYDAEAGEDWPEGVPTRVDDALDTLAGREAGVGGGATSEAELESDLADVADVYTDNDGVLAPTSEAALESVLTDVADVLTDNDVPRSVRGRVTDPGTPILVLRFDDGRESMSTTAWPALRSRGLNGSFYITSGIWGSSLGDEDVMSEVEAQAMIAQGADFQVHGALAQSCSSFSYDVMVENNWIPDINWIWTNGGYVASSYAPPGHGYNDACEQRTAHYFQDVNISEIAYSNALGITHSVTTGNQFRISSAPVDGSLFSTGADLAAAVKAILLGSRAPQMMNLNFHSILDCGGGGGEPACSLTIVDTPVFTAFLDEMVTLQNAGLISVLPASQAYSLLSAHLPPWNLFLNPGWGSIQNAADAIDEWNDGGDQTCATISDLGHGIGRECDLDQAAGNRLFNQEVYGLIPGRVYRHAIECEWNTSDTSVTLTPQVRYAASSFPTLSGTSVTGTSGEKQSVGMTWVAKSSVATVGWSIGGDSTPNLGALTCRLPYLRVLGSEGGDRYDTSSPRLEAFRSTPAASTAIAGSATEVIDVLAVVERNTGSDSLRVNEGPARFLVTNVTLDSSTAGAVDLDCHLETLSAGGGTDSCFLTTATTDPASYSVACPALDDDAFTEGGSSDGNTIHLECTNNDAASNTVTVTLEGVVLN